MAIPVTKDWINTVYVNLTDTLANSEHNINSGITKKTYGQEIMTDDQINSLIDSIRSLSNNIYIKNYADCFKNSDPLDKVSTDTIIKGVTKTQIDNYIEDILDICQNQVQSTIAATGNTNHINNFSPASGCTDKGNNFSPASGCTNYGNNFSPASGCTNNGNNFRAGNSNVGHGSGNTNKGNNFVFFSTNSASKGVGGRCADFFRATRSGNTNQGNNFRRPTFATESNAGGGSGNTNKGNNFRSASGFANNGNTFSGASGFTNKGNNFSPASGFTNYGNTFSGSSGNTNKGNNFRAASGFTNYGNNFRAARTRVDFKVRISGALVTNSNTV